MALSVASGTPFHGRTVQQGQVLYVAAEGGAPIGKRIKAWEHEHGIEVGDLTWLLEPVILDGEEEADNLIANLEHFEKKPILVIFDTLNWCMGGEENNSKDMARVLRTARRLGRTFDCTVLVVHHPPKSNDKTHRGSGALSAGLTTNIRVEYDGEWTIMECLKQKDDEPFETLFFVHCKVADSLVMQEAEKQAERRPRATRKNVVLEVMKQHSDGLSKQKLVEECVEAGMAKKTAYRHILKLERSKRLIPNDVGFLVAA